MQTKKVDVREVDVANVANSTIEMICALCRHDSDAAWKVTEKVVQMVRTGIRQEYDLGAGK